MSEKKKQTAAELKDEELKKVAGGTYEDPWVKPRTNPIPEPEIGPASGVVPEPTKRPK